MEEFCGHFGTLLSDSFCNGLRAAAGCLFWRAAQPCRYQACIPGDEFAAAGASTALEPKTFIRQSLDPGTTNRVAVKHAQTDSDTPGKLNRSRNNHRAAGRYALFSGAQARRTTQEPDQRQ